MRKTPVLLINCCIYFVVFIIIIIFLFIYCSVSFITFIKWLQSVDQRHHQQQQKKWRKIKHMLKHVSMAMLWNHRENESTETDSQITTLYSTPDNKQNGNRPTYVYEMRAKT